MAQNMQITWGQKPSLKARKSPLSNEPPAQVTARRSIKTGGLGRSFHTPLFRAGGGARARHLGATWSSFYPPGFLASPCPLILPACLPHPHPATQVGPTPVILPLPGSWETQGSSGWVGLNLPTAAPHCRAPEQGVGQWGCPEGHRGTTSGRD